MKTLAIILSVLLLVGTTMVPVAGQSSVSGNAPRFDGVVLSDTVCTTSGTFVGMPGMQIVFPVPRVPSLPQFDNAIVSFGTELTTLRLNQAVEFRLLVDGSPAFGPLLMQFTFVSDVGTWDYSRLIKESSQVGVRSFNTIIGPLAADTSHSVELQWRVSFGSEHGEICVRNRSLIVSHR